MKKIKDIMRLMRIKHWIKNFLIFLPAFFERNLLEPSVLANLLPGFLAFGLVTSVVYIINDLKDVEKDRKHEIKCKRPIASGAVSGKEAKYLIVILEIGAVGMLLLLKTGHNWQAAGWCLVYLVLNIGYSMGLKNMPIVDIAILASGFIIRVMYGASVSDVTASNWLCLTVMAFALYMGIGKRRNELKRVGGSSTRDVLKYYDLDFLDKNMTIVTTLGIVFYSLWAGTVIENNLVIWTVPLVIFIIMKYEMIIRGESYGDPVEVLLSDKVLLGLVFIYAVIMVLLIYGIGR